MVGAVLSLFLIGLMRFGMGLLNIQEQVQGIAIGLLLVLSILLPSLARQMSEYKTRISRRSIVYIAGAVLALALFLLFFFWSRIPIISSM